MSTQALLANLYTKKREIKLSNYRPVNAAASWKIERETRDIPDSQKAVFRVRNNANNYIALGFYNLLIVDDNGIENTPVVYTGIKKHTADEINEIYNALHNPASIEREIHAYDQPLSSIDAAFIASHVITNTKYQKINPYIVKKVDYTAIRNRRMRALHNRYNKEPEQFEPSNELIHIVQKSANEKRKEINDKAMEYRAMLKGEDRDIYNKTITALPDTSEQQYDAEQIRDLVKREIAKLLATIARTQSQLGDSSYTLTEDGRFNDDVLAALMGRLPLRLKSFNTFVEVFNKALVRSVKSNVIGGKWGNLSYDNGELIVNITIQSNIIDREWTKAQLI